jgi:GT2 family glycosyltransferase
VRQGWLFLDEGLAKSGDGRSGAFNFNENAAAVVADKSSKLVFLGETIDERPEAYALDDAGYGKAQAFPIHLGCRFIRVTQLMPRELFYSMPVKAVSRLAKLYAGLAVYPNYKPAARPIGTFTALGHIAHHRYNSPMLDLSIIIVSYNTKQLLEECLQSLAEAEQPANGAEIIVVDNASADGSQAMVRKKFPDVHLLANAENVGFSTANNLGAAVAEGRVLLFLNSDTRLAKEALVQPLDYLEAHPQVGAITVRLYYPNGDRDPDNHRGFPTPWNALCHFSGLSRLFPNNPRFNGYFQSYVDFNKTHAVEVIAGSFMMMPRRVYDQLGGWDETYFFYGEDIDFCYRIGEAGYDIIYYPHVEVLHYKGASSGLRKESAEIARPPKETRVKVAQESVRAMKVFYRKFYSEKYPRFVTGMVLAGIQIRGWLRIIKHRLMG